MTKKSSSNSSSGVGSINPAKKKKKKQVCASRHWDFVVNNYTDADVEKIISSSSSTYPIIVFQDEIGETGTRHLQGVLSFAVGEKGRPLVEWVHIMGHGRMSWRKVKSIKHTRKYCCKDKDRYNGHSQDVAKPVRYFRGWKKPRDLEIIEYNILWDKQKAIVDMFAEPEDARFGRNIYWFWESVGNWGKSIIVAHLIDCRGALMLSGKTNDIFYAISCYVDRVGEGPEIIVLDIPRSHLHYVNYTAIESVKNGRFFSGKYEGGMVQINRPHIICFANEPPNIDTMSHDRWKIRELAGD